jgi:plastocyanin
MRTLSAALVALALVAVGCSEGEAGGGGAPFEVPGEPVATSAVELPRSYRFEPAVIAIDVGTEVTWSNRDDFPHDVTLLDGSGVSVDLPVGASASIAFDEAGTVFYQCSIHPQQMHGKVVVAA